MTTFVLGRGGQLLAVLLPALGIAMAAAATAGVLPSREEAVTAYEQLHGAGHATTAGPVIRGATPRAHCGPGSLPETGRQGRVPAVEYTNGRAAKGYTCNTVARGHQGETGGYQVDRYVDRAGHVCAFYDATLLFPKDVRRQVVGTAVLDMSHPTHPVQTASLVTPAFDTPHESMRLNARRGLLVAVSGNPYTQAGIVDVYDVASDCRHPIFKGSVPIGYLGHEGGFAPDGKTYWVSATAQPGITAVGLEDPAHPHVLWQSFDYKSHGIAVSDDGTRLYLAEPGGTSVTPVIVADGPGLRILDVSQIQHRRPNPMVKQVSYLTWPDVSIPQNSVPVTVHHRHYLVEFDEFDSNEAFYAPENSVGAVRIIDIQNERKPRVISRIRLEVHQTAARASDQQNDPQATFPLQGYAAHYCSVPRRLDPGILACSMILSGLRIFDIHDPYHPRELGYFNHPRVSDDTGTGLERGGYAMSAPAFDPAHKSIWYTDGNSGFWNVELTNGIWTPRGKYPVETL
jgi:hypothetical protein